ncbi:hypothetical protein EAI_17576 [Harpegnathos saltator]|uniref:Uncharacterized protein n=1 Tax=Harpegnathos saltator TaxID=610380 RepID=E2BA85_HARSA|nr:hypothetical protein EAI_17576 [Harpegnathos saltator]
MLANSLLLTAAAAAAAATAWLLDNNVSAAAVGARMTLLSKMRMADLESSAGGYAYNQQPGLPLSYVRYTNHGSGRYYRAPAPPAPVYYAVVGSPAPVAPAVSETALSHEPVLLAHATTTTKHEIAPYAARQPYPRDGFINYGVGQLAKYAQPLKPPKPAAQLHGAETENKKGHSDVAGNYGRREGATWGEKGSSYGHTSYRKKGQKTSGFRKAYHKDEYKKDTDFYDESHKEGRFDKHSAADGRYNAAMGSFKESGRRESESDRESNGKKGYHDEGRKENHERGYDREEGEDSFRANHDSYESDEDAHLTKKHEYDKSGEHRQLAAS